MEIKIPTVGESVIEALLAKWHKADGDLVQKDEPLCEIETDKITMDLYAEVAGRLTIVESAGTMLPVGRVIGALTEGDVSAVTEQAAAAVTTARLSGLSDAPTSPAVRQALSEQGLSAGEVPGGGPGGRILMSNLTGVVVSASEIPEPPVVPQPMLVKSEEPPVYQTRQAVAHPQPVAGEERVRMSPLRKRIAERLLQARQQTAMLTTFNEVDLQALQALRASRKQAGQPVGLLPFFVRATVESLVAYPAVNARIEGDEIIYHHFQHLGIAVSSDKGLVVPVLRDAGQLLLPDIDGAIAGFVEKIKTNRLAIADLEGGTFTLSNGGTYGSMLSTPIINPPQSGVLGMHAIQDRAVVRDGQVVIRPMMYLALSYDHRIIDGREAVGFLKMVKESLEDSRWLAGLN
jgi:2-oxoglutarate dehydrogenase E2 component (dihydrolipoamide succinyltransferase)